MVIYKITNKINGKVYIGQTINTLEQRWYHHCHNKRDTIFSRAIRKYGKENFTVEQIDIACDRDELNKKEIYWIACYDSANLEKGYNMTSGGESGKEMTLESRQRLSKSLKGKSSGFKGKHHTEESKKLISKNSARLSGKNHKQSKSIICVETGEIFESMGDVKRKCGIEKSHIWRCCVGKRITAGGYHWKYADSI